MAHVTVHPPQNEEPPKIDRELLEYLNRIFQIQLSEHFDLREYDRQLGQQDVLSHLRAVHDNQRG